MNERIQKLIKQATVEVPLYYGPAGIAHTKKFNKEKFAELIIRECARRCEMSPYPHPNYSVAIKEHFGVE